MQRSLRFNENQYIYLANKAKNDSALCASLWKKSRESLRWQQKYFVLYQNFLFYYENESSVKPMGCYLLEGSYCEHVIPSAKTAPDRQFMFSISFRGEGGRQLELACDDQEQCDFWVASVQRASFNLLRMHKEELEKKFQHLLKIIDTERDSKSRYMSQCEEQAEENAKLRSELLLLKQQLQRLKSDQSRNDVLTKEETEELRKIKKVQSLMRGWLCRRRWMSIVNEYIKSPHAQMMRTRNRLVFAMVADEEDYVEKLSTLVTVFYRTLKMAASSKKPLISHEDVNSIFLNCETILFLHQIFSKGLNARLEAWPRLILGDLFDMLLPMLSIYQEYVRNHHYSLQVLAECKQKRPEFGAFLQRYEEKSVCCGRTIEHYLTVPMWQIPRYIQSLFQILAHTPHDHVERKSLEYARHQLETLSTTMRDEVSETENIRRNLAIERQIVEGCDILLDVQQIFIRQGTMLQACLASRSIANASSLSSSGSKSQLGESASSGSNSNSASRSGTMGGSGGGMGGSGVNGSYVGSLSNSGSSGSGSATIVSSSLNKKKSNPSIMFGVGSGGTGGHSNSFGYNVLPTSMDKKEAIKQCFLFSNHLIVTSRTSSGKLHLNKLCGKISLADATLLDDDISGDPNENGVSSQPGVLSPGSNSSVKDGAHISEYHGRSFKLAVSQEGFSYLFLFVAPTNQEKEAWVTDIGQCIENIHISGLLAGQVRFEESSSIRMLQSVRSDPSLFKDDPQIKFSRSTNSCRVPQIRYATVDKLLDRLIDVRFLSIEFLNTFLMTYRYFTTAQRVMQVLRHALLNLPSNEQQATTASNSSSPSSNSTSGTLTNGGGAIMSASNSSQSALISWPESATEAGQSNSPGVSASSQCLSVTAPQTPSPVEQMVANPSTYRMRKNTAPSVINSINNQSADAMKRRMAGQNRKNSDNSISCGKNGGVSYANDVINSDATETKTIPSKSSSRTSLSDNSFESKSTGGVGATMSPLQQKGYHVELEAGVAGLDAATIEKLSPESADTTSSSDSGIGNTISHNNMNNNTNTNSSNSSNSSTFTNSSSSGAAGSIRASLTSIGEFVARKHQQLSAVNKQYSVESDDSSFLVYSIKDSDTDSLGNQRPSSLESLEDNEKTIIEKVKEAALRISESSLNHSQHAASPDNFDKSLCSNRDSIHSLTSSMSCGSMVNGKRFSLDSYVHSKTEPSPSHHSSFGKKFAPGVVVTSSRKSTRRSSLQTAAAAFAAATAGATSSPSLSSNSNSGGGASGATSGGKAGQHGTGTTRSHLAARRNNAPSSLSGSTLNFLSKTTKTESGRKSSDFSSATSMRVLHVLRHWSTKFPEDFEEGEPANQLLISMLKEAQANECLTCEEEKIVNGIYRALTNFEESKDDFVALLGDLKHENNPTDDHSFPDLTPFPASGGPSGAMVTLESIPALEIAENLTFIEYKVFAAIPFWEFFNQAWVKEDKHEKAPRILLTTKRFNDVSTLVATTILREPTEKGRAVVIEKWAGVADVCKGMHNFNSVLEIISAFGRTPVYRLRKTWDRVSKQARSTIDKLQNLVSTDGHFKNMRDALHKCDPPALPYLGMYLTDLTFIEDGTPMVTADSLINFSRMRMISNVVQEIRLYQQTPYQVELKSDTLKWLLQSGHVWTEEQMYNKSLELEPRPTPQSNSSRTTHNL